MWLYPTQLSRGPKFRSLAFVQRSTFTVAVAAGLAAAGWLMASVPQIPWELVAYGRSLTDPTQHNLQFENNGQIHDTNARLLYLGEGRNSSVAVTELGNGWRNFHVSGKVEASTEPQDMRLQRMLGHIPAMLHGKPESVLIVGCGAGVTAGSFIVYPDVKRIVICEIEPLIPSKVAPFFAQQNYDVVNNPRVEIHYDDARHYLLTTKEKFDIITSDPIHPWVKGAATLYTEEYFKLVRQHLNPGGMVTQWVPLYESTPAVVKSEMATFFKVFPHGTIWSNDFDGKGYDTVVLGEADDAPLRIDVEELKASWERPDHEEVKHSLSEVGFHSPLDMLATYAGRATDLQGWLADAQINRDRNLRLQYLAGMGLNRFDGGLILDQILAYFKYPDDLFISSPEFRTQLDQAMQRPATAVSETSMLAITHVPSPAMESGERTFVGRAAIDHALAAEQHRAYCQLLTDCGATVITLDVNRHLPDCAFVEDTAVVLDEIAVLTTMGAESRRAELPGIAAELRKHRKVVPMSLPATLEGGDVLRIGKTLLVGQSSRTNAAGITQLQEIVRPYGYRVVPVAVARLFASEDRLLRVAGWPLAREL